MVSTEAISKLFLNWPLLFPYLWCYGDPMTPFSKIFTTRALVQIIFVLTAVVVMKGLSAHYGFSWATALAAD
jgi:hypothetical protein